VDLTKIVASCSVAIGTFDAFDLHPVEAFFMATNSWSSGQVARAGSDPQITAKQNIKINGGNAQIQSGTNRKQPPVNGEMSRRDEAGSVSRDRHAKSKMAMSAAATAPVVALAQLNGHVALETAAAKTPKAAMTSNPPSMLMP
jgi:hypothetical protein